MKVPYREYCGFLGGSSTMKKLPPKFSTDKKVKEG
jgi:hypothetical protein